MTDIRVTHTGGEEYGVEVREGKGATHHRVQVPADALERYGAGAEAETLVEESFRFLLEREPKESILSSFEISVIERYFPEYPGEIRGRLGGR
ncbi:MAG: hypothetical protein R3266_02810 [Gemmatimonadota bacterium]|nr:hypothetical protein [Gemmatimonadota bacterium]